jgi:hypothetical protein
MSVGANVTLALVLVGKPVDRHAVGSGGVVLINPVNCGIGALFERSGAERGQDVPSFPRTPFFANAPPSFAAHLLRRCDPGGQCDSGPCPPPEKGRTTVATPISI